MSSKSNAAMDVDISGRSRRSAGENHCEVASEVSSLSRKKVMKFYTVQANSRPSNAGNKQLMCGASGVFPCARRKEHGMTAWRRRG